MSERALELIRALKHLPGKHPQKSHAGGRGSSGAADPLQGSERTIERSSLISGPTVELSYEKMQPIPAYPSAMQRDQKFGSPMIKAVVQGDTVQIVKIHAGNTKRTGIGTAMVRDLLKETGATKVASSGVESADGKAFLDALAKQGFEVVGR